MYKSAFLGCGPRARKHAAAYEFVNKGKAVAACDLDSDRLSSFAADFGIGNSYQDVHEMLEKEKPDLLHIVTDPTLRVPLMTIASDHAVPVVIIEKPIAVQGEDWKDLNELSKTTKTKFIINTQLHYHKKNIELRNLVAEGMIGDILFVDVSARSTILDQGVHILELAHSYSGYPDPVSVFAQISGAETLSTKQPSPDTAEASICFDNGVRAQMVTGYYAPQSNPTDVIYHHKRIAVYGTKGFVNWTMVGWDQFTEGSGYQSGSHDYGTEDDLAQAVLTDAAFAAIDDPSLTPETRLELSLTQFNIILGAYMSAIHRKPIDLPCIPDNGLLDEMKSIL